MDVGTEVPGIGARVPRASERASLTRGYAGTASTSAGPSSSGSGQWGADPVQGFVQQRVVEITAKKGPGSGVHSAAGDVYRSEPHRDEPAGSRDIARQERTSSQMGDSSTDAIRGAVMRGLRDLTGFSQADKPIPGLQPSSGSLESEGRADVLTQASASPTAKREAKTSVTLSTSSLARKPVSGQSRVVSRNVVSRSPPSAGRSEIESVGRAVRVKPRQSPDAQQSSGTEGSGRRGIGGKTPGKRSPVTAIRPDGRVHREDPTASSSGRSSPSDANGSRSKVESVGRHSIQASTGGRIRIPFKSKDLQNEGAPVVSRAAGVHASSAPSPTPSQQSQKLRMTPKAADQKARLTDAPGIQVADADRKCSGDERVAGAPVACAGTVGLKVEAEGYNYQPSQVIGYHISDSRLLPQVQMAFVDREEQGAHAVLSQSLKVLTILRLKTFFKVLPEGIHQFRTGRWGCLYRPVAEELSRTRLRV